MYANIKPLIKLKKELNLLDYIVPNKLKVKPGQLVEIPFRNRNIYGIVFDLKKTSKQPQKILKPIDKIINPRPLFSLKQIQFYQFFIEHNFSSLNFLNNITPLPLKRKTSITEEKINVQKINWKLKNIPDSILKNKQFIFKHNYFSEKISLIKKTIDNNKQETLIISPTKLHLEKIYSYLLNFYKENDITTITGYTHLNKTEHNQIWQDIKNKKTKIILGTKTAIFYPLDKIDSIIIDEAENENHNQIDINPRFELLPNIIKLAKINNSQLIFSTYAPPANLYHLAQKKQIKFLETKNKINTEIRIMEMDTKYFANQIHFNTEEYINETLENNGKILFLINKKGYSKSLFCPDCKYIFKCPDCNGIPSFKANNTLYCYNCRQEMPLPLKCPQCQNTKLKFKGIGSAQLYSKIKESFPNYQTILIDKDHENNLKLIKDHQIVIATRLIIDYLNKKDFDLIVLPIAHQFLNSNFDSNEKFYQFCSKLISLQPEQLILQILQELKIYDYLKNQQYPTMIEEELKTRKLFHYPPFYKMLKITIKDKSPKKLDKKIISLYNKIKNNLPTKTELLPIIDPTIKKTFNFYLKYIIIKYPLNADLNKLKPILKKIDIIECI